MPNRNYQRGVRFERALMKEWSTKGYLMLRTAGSHGPFDLAAIPANPNWPVELIQCKVTKSEKTAERLRASFKSNPPLLLSKHYHQSLAVKFGTTILWSTV